MLGRDVIGICKTGSGKTLAYALPLQRRLKAKQKNPQAVVLVPTHELCLQVTTQIKKFTGIKCAAVYGGGEKHLQWKALRSGVGVVVATPNRLIDLVKAKACSLKEVFCFVLDEADLMLGMGFEYQVRSILELIPASSQVILMSATFKKKLQRLAKDFLKDPIKVVVGKEGEVNKEVDQELVVLDHYSKKLSWLTQRLPEFLQKGLVLVFVNRKSTTQELSQLLRKANLPVAYLHGDLDQYTRHTTISAFKNSETKILVATDVASRGLDISNLATVVNYECAKDPEIHLHRVGRAGRGNLQGKAYTLLTKEDQKFSGELLLSLEYNELEVPKQLEELAMKDPKFRGLRAKHTHKQAPRVKRPQFNIEQPGNIRDFREYLEETKKQELARKFKSSFVKAETMDVTTKK